MSSRASSLLAHRDYQLTSLPGVFMSVLTNDNRLQLEATTHFRKLLSKERSPPIEEVINTNDVPHLVEFLVRENFSQLQLNEHANLSMLKNATWTLPNFYRAKAQPPFDQVKPLPALERLIHSNDKEVLTVASWALPYLSDGTNDKIQPVIEAEVCARLVELLGHPSPAVFISALPTGGNIVTGNDMQTQGGSASDETKLIKIELTWPAGFLVAFEHESRKDPEIKVKLMDRPYIHYFIIPVIAEYEVLPSTYEHGELIMKKIKGFKRHLEKIGPILPT